MIHFPSDYVITLKIVPQCPYRNQHEWDLIREVALRSVLRIIKVIERWWNVALLF